MAFPAGSTDINDLAATVAQQAEQIRILQAQVNGLLSHLDPWTGELKNVQCGFLRLDRDGAVLEDGSSNSIVKEGLFEFNAQTSGVYFYSGAAWHALSSW